MSATEDTAVNQTASVLREPTSADAGAAQEASVNWLAWISLAVVFTGGAFLWGWPGGPQASPDNGTPLPIGTAAPSLSLTECQGETIGQDSDLCEAFQSRPILLVVSDWHRRRRNLPPGDRGFFSDGDSPVEG